MFSPGAQSSTTNKNVIDKKLLVSEGGWNAHRRADKHWRWSTAEKKFMYIDVPKRHGPIDRKLNRGDDCLSRSPHNRS